MHHPIVVERAILPLYKVTDLPFALCPITPALTSSVHHSSHQLTTAFLAYYNVT